MHVSSDLLFITAAAASYFVPGSQALKHTPLVVPTLHDFYVLSSQSKFNLNPESISSTFQAYNLSVPVDHFHNDSRYAPHTDDTFSLRYWFSAEHYQPHGPVFVIAAGETSGTDRFPFLQSGIVQELSRVYHGIGVVLEHRYYGTSFPITNSSSAEAFRFLTTDQAVADTAYFANHVVFPGLEHLNLTAASGNAPWIAYGGSYAGAFVAFLRKLYPETYWGAISTSGVTEAIVDYWEYYDIIRRYGPSPCIETLQNFVSIVDNILIESKNRTLRYKLKEVFGLTGVIDDQDFASILTYGLQAFQGRNWDRDVSSVTFGELCANVTSEEVLYNDTGRPNLREAVGEVITAGGQDGTNSTLVTRMLNWIGFINTSFINPTLSSSPFSNDMDASLLFSTPATAPQHSTIHSLSQPDNWWLSWMYQVCTQWGYFSTGSGVPPSLPPLISRTIDLTYSSAACTTFFNINSLRNPPNVSEINIHAGYNFSFPRVAIIDGVADPWRGATPHVIGFKDRIGKDDEEPWLLLDVKEEDVWDGIRGGVHHWDQNGLFDEEIKDRRPSAVREVHEEVIRFVGVWIKQWKEEKHKKSGHREGADTSFVEEL